MPDAPGERLSATSDRSALTGERLGALAYRYRVYVLCVVICAVMAAVAPNFRTSGMLANVLKATAVNLPAAVGFTLVLICGQLDLSVGAGMTMGGMLVVGLAPRLGWTGSFLVAAAFGALTGLANGVLVAKAKINSFIVTLGAMMILQNAMYIYGEGGTIPVQSFGLSDWYREPILWVITPQILIPFLVMGAVALFLNATRAGKGLFLLGGNPQTAWYSGLRVDRYVILAFVLSGLLSAIGGAVYSMSEAQANPTLGDNSLMAIVAAVIIGGTSMAGGRGTVVGTTAALIALAALIKGLNCLGAGYEIELMASGLVLALVILYDAWRIQQAQRIRGQRRELLTEVPALEARDFEEEDDDDDESIERSDAMQSKDKTLPVVCVTALGCVAIVAIMAMVMTRDTSPKGVVSYVAAPGSIPGGGPGAPAAAPGGHAGPDDHVMTMMATDGQPLIVLDDTPLVPPKRPADPSALPKEDPLHWYDMEYAGWATTGRAQMPVSPGDGPAGKRVVCLRHMDHPYTTAYTRGMQRIADAYGIKLKTLTAGNADVNIQSQQVDHCINVKPDLVIIFPVDATAVVPMLRRLNRAGIPVIASNLLPIDEGMKYVLTWTGPDDWGQFRMLAREFAERMNYQGAYAVVQHMPGGSCFFSRTWSVISELKKIAPKMKCLEMQTTKLEPEKSTQVVSDWLTKYGKELKGIVSADDSGAQTGINEACKNMNREDIIRVAAGNSKVGMDFIKAGTLHAITYQSPEADGALPMKIAADWFSGKPIARTVYYLQKQIITKENVDKFLPAQW